MPLVTMFTDASWHRETSIGVWAMWAKLDGNTIRYSGRLKGQVPQIGTAELSAIANGLFFVQRDFACPKGSRIIVQTDSLEAISALKKHHHRRPEDLSIVIHIKEFGRTNGWLLALRHVKGHKGKKAADYTSRHAVNGWCDIECRRQMGLALEQKVTTSLETVE